MTTTPTPATDQHGPYDREPSGPFIPQDQRRALLAAASAGAELGDYDRRILDWLAGWDTPTVLAVAGIIYRARVAGALFGFLDLPTYLNVSAPTYARAEQALTRLLDQSDPARLLERPTAVEVAESRAQVNRLARKRRRELAGTDAADLAPTRAETRAAAELLADWLAAGRRRGIPPDDWHVITHDLPALALDAMVHIARLA